MNKADTSAQENADRIARIADRALLLLEAGKRVMSILENPPECHCKYANGRPRYVNTQGRFVHNCGRS